MSTPLSPTGLRARIDTLLEGDDYGIDHWNTSANSPFVLTYQFYSQRAPDFDWYDVRGIVDFPVSQRTQFAAAFAQFAEVANVRFVEVSGGADADIGLYRANNLGGSGIAGLGGWYYDDYPDWEGNAVFQSSLNLGKSNNISLILHELGHTMGLRHPGDYDVAGGELTGPFLSAAEDNDKFSVMSYNLRPGATQYNNHLMLYDIAALQEFWGANLTTRTGDDTYTRYAGSQTRVIWDAGGTDTLAASGAGAATLDLRAGAFSSIGAFENVAIAYGVTIENARGAGGSDTIRGNDASNTLTGGGGNDFLMGGGGDDYLFGKTGRDTAGYDGNSADYTRIAFQGKVVVLSHVDGTDTLDTMEWIRFADTTITTKSVAQFNAVAYLAANQDLVPSIGSDSAAAFSHYIHFGYDEGRMIG